MSSLIIDSTAKIPTVDITKGIDIYLEELFHGLLTTGFVMVTGFDDLSDLINKTEKEARGVFGMTIAEKMHYAMKEIGYTPEGVEHARDADDLDIKEFWQIRPGYTEKQFPTQFPDFKVSTLQLFSEVEKIGKSALGAIEKGFGLPAGALTDLVLNGSSLLRLLYYAYVRPNKYGFLANPHTDINFITVLYGGAKGLIVRGKNGQWILVDTQPGSFVINVGDMLHSYLQYRYHKDLPSTVHAVIPADNTDGRISMPLFLHPRPDVIIGPNRLTAGQALKKRLEEIGIY